MNILLVEDSNLSANRILTILSSFNFKVDWYTSADEVIENKIDFNSFDVVILDLILKGTLNGVKLAEYIREAVDNPIIFMSSFSQSDLIESSIKFNPDAFIMKPFNLEQVKTAIQMALYKFKIRKELKVNEELVSSLQQNQIEIEIEGREAERRRVASELHDGLGQMLTAIKININHLFKLGSIDEAIEDLKNLIDETIHETHRISEDLSPSNIEHLTFLECIGALINGMSNAKLNFHFENYDFPEDLNPRTKINLYRIIQETITNAVKHSKATNFNVRLFRINDLLRIMLEDDGIGIENSKDNLTGRGFQNIRNRVQILGGEVVFDSVKNEGTTVIVEFLYDFIEAKKAVL